MPEAAHSAPTLIERPISIARLHAKACFDCGSVHKPMRPAGSVQLRGSDRVWPIVTCGCREGK
jgi:hypothetical protein